MAPSARHQRSEKRFEEETRDHRHHHRVSRRRSRSLQRRDSPKRDHPSNRRASPIRDTRRSRSPQSRRAAESDRSPVNRRATPPRGSAAYRAHSPSPRRNRIPRSRSPGNNTRAPQGGSERGSLRPDSRNLSPGRRSQQDRISTPSAANHPSQPSSARPLESDLRHSGDKRKAQDRPADLLPDKRRRVEDSTHDRRRPEFNTRDREHHRASSPRPHQGRRGDRPSDRRRRARSPPRGPRQRSPPPSRRRSPPRNRASRLNSPSRPGSSRRPLSPGPRDSGQSSRSRHLEDIRRSRTPDMYPQSGGNYYPAQHGRNYPPPIDTRYAQQSPHGAGPSPQHGYGPRGDNQGAGYAMSNAWSPTHAPQGYPPNNSDSRGYGAQGGPSPSNYHSQASPYSRPLPSPGSARGHHAFSPQGSPPGPQSHASSPHHTGNPSRRGSLSSRGGFAPQSRKGSESSSTPASSRGGASARGGAHFSNLTWKPNVGVRGGQAPTSLFQTQQKKKEEEEAEAKKSEASERNLAGPTDPNDPENPFRVPDNAAVNTDERAPRADPDDPDNPFRVPDDSRRPERGSDRPPNGKNTSSDVMQQPPDGPKISFNMKKPASGSAPLAPKRDLLNQAKAQAASAENSRQPPPTDPKRDREQDRRSLYSIRDNRDNRDSRDDRGRDRRDNRDRDDYRGGSGRDRHQDRGRDRFGDPDRDRGRNGMSRSEREMQDRPAKPAKPKAPPVSLPDLNSMGRTARYAPAPPTIPVSVTADTPVWLIRQLLDGARQNHRRKARLPPADWLKSNPPKLSLPEEQRTAKSQYPKQEDSVVGAGTYGQVYKTINVYKPNQGAVALKRVAMASESQNNGFPFTSVRELGAIVSIKDLRIPKYIESMVERVTQQQQGAPEKVDLWYYMVFEYVPYDLAGIINHPTVKLELAHRKDLAKQMYDGLVWLHSVGILHRDIKAGNILVDHSCTLKITDFGLAKRYDLATGPKAKHTNRIVTIWYRCPELLLGDNYYGTEPDFWAAACVLGEILLENGQALFPGPGTDVMQLDYMWTILGKPTKEEWPSMTKKPWYNLLLLDDQYRRKIHDSGGSAKRYVRKFEDRYTEKFTPAAMQLLQSCLQWDPAKRPDGHQVLAHRFFTEEEPAPQRFTGLGDALGGDFHEFDYKKHRDAARAQQREQQKAERDQRKRDEAAAAREKLKRGAEASDIDSTGTGGEASVNKKPKRASIDAKMSSAAADSQEVAKTADEDLSMEVEVSMEPGAPIDPSDGPVAGADAGVDGGNDAGEMDVDDVIKPSA